MSAGTSGSDTSSSPRCRASLAAYESTQKYSKISQLEVLQARVQPFSWENIRQKTLLGKGAFSEVYRVDMDVPRYNDKKFALKYLSSKITDNAEGDFDIAAIDLAMEATMLSRLNHDNIIELHGIYGGDLKTSYTDSEKGYFLLLDLLEDTLPKRLDRCRAKERRRRLTSSMVSCTKLVQRIQEVGLGIAKGMQYLHQNGVIFRDLKPDNVGFTRDGRPVIFDFGFAREISTLKEDEIAGSLRYMSPEMAFGQTPTLASDVYSFGILLFELCSLQKPFKQFKDRTEFTEHVLVGDYRPSLQNIPSVAIKKIIETSWDADHTKRPDMNHVAKVLHIEIALAEYQFQARSVQEVSSGSFRSFRSFRKRQGLSGTDGVGANAKWDSSNEPMSRSSANLLSGKQHISRSSANLLSGKQHISRSSANLFSGNQPISRSSANLFSGNQPISRSSANLIISNQPISRSSANLFRGSSFRHEGLSIADTLTCDEEGNYISELSLADMPTSTAPKRDMGSKTQSWHRKSFSSGKHSDSSCNSNDSRLFSDLSARIRKPFKRLSFMKPTPKSEPQTA
eukprot:CAMPEP_0201136232 /NCGR_PEP_ID=MMETSP0850-20130426/54774_1 /ASSEMBLY_ACC=CAM_ASM_000622 /TAXON_ID=183588 /ORGANISM="Pseudo-nitzschia fraudulenta, Strain WWA7" /LENGTH=566 /DNA_ID=CAMNT_0047407521 /DNA_START=80 /DNA_END=1780 /DNA_ORIENTATION=+